MNDQTNSEKNPLDELFARRLGKLDRPPSVDSFARLQQRMQGKQEQPRVVTWWQQSTLKLAIAASIAVVLLFGWFYLNDKNDRLTDSTQTAVAVRNDVNKRSIEGKMPQSLTSSSDNTSRLAQQSTTGEATNGAGKTNEQKRDRTVAINNDEKQRGRIAAGPSQQQDEKPANTSIAATGKTIQPVEAVAVQPPVRERVLVVTIEEPEALVAARQTAASVVNNMPVLAASPSKENKATFWQQVKRLKQDDDVARQEDSPNDDSGLLGRAYKGIKHRLEKDKPAKQ